MAFTYDFATAPQTSLLRLMVGDTEAPGIFSDAEITAVLNCQSSGNIIVGLSGYTPAVPVPQIFSYGRAAAMLLNSLGSVRARALVLKVLDVSMDTSKATAALKDLGQSYIDQEVSGGYFAVSEMVQDAFSMRERLWKMVYRQNDGQ